MKNKIVLFSVGFVVLILLIVITTYWIKSTNKIEQLNLDIETQKFEFLNDLQTRFEKISFSTDTINQATADVKEQLLLITEARSKMNQYILDEKYDEADEQAKIYVEGLNSINVIFEDNPESWNTLGLTKAQINEFNAESNMIRTSVNKHNDLVKEYNYMLVTFPYKIFLGKFDVRSDQLLLSDYDFKIPN